MKKTKLSYIILILVFLTGICLVLYPGVSNYLNSLHQTSAIAEYSNEVSSIEESESKKIIESAKVYNQGVIRDVFELDPERKKEYDKQLNLGVNGIMGYIEIPKIEVSLPIYHSTEPEILQIGVGHMEWSSLPVGGRGTHCYLSGHRGLPSSKLFTDLDRLAEDDTFSIVILDKILTYAVDRILIVEPYDTSVLTIEEEGDYCTLVTCTPYGINTHRLLVRGHRVETSEQFTPIVVNADAVLMKTEIIAPILSIPLFLMLLILLMTEDIRRNKKERILQAFEEQKRIEKKDFSV